MDILNLKINNSFVHESMDENSQAVILFQRLHEETSLDSFKSFIKENLNEITSELRGYIEAQIELKPKAFDNDIFGQVEDFIEILADHYGMMQGSYDQ